MWRVNLQAYKRRVQEWVNYRNKAESEFCEEIKLEQFCSVYKWRINKKPKKYEENILRCIHNQQRTQTFPIYHCRAFPPFSYFECSQVFFFFFFSKLYHLFCQCFRRRFLRVHLYSFRLRRRPFVSLFLILSFIVYVRQRGRVFSREISKCPLCECGRIYLYAWENVFVVGKVCSVLWSFQEGQSWNWQR